MAQRVLDFGRKVMVVQPLAADQLPVELGGTGHAALP